MHTGDLDGGKETQARALRKNRRQYLISATSFSLPMIRPSSLAQS
jgi:hypothetical protein